ncbi:MAG: Rieske (2Fe-2S) protein [Bacteroidota bacterium]
MKHKKQNRRYFLKSVIAAFAIGTVALWDKMIVTQKKIDTRRTISLLLETNKRISFQDNFIVINNDDKITVLSSRCTHLGCKINEAVDNKLLCPCHGSTFDLKGNATKGPANRPLEMMKFEFDKSANTIIVTT